MNLPDVAYSRLATAIRSIPATSDAARARQLGVSPMTIHRALKGECTEIDADLVARLAGLELWAMLAGATTKGKRLDAVDLPTDGLDP
jgi:hypothetical protein